MALAVFKDLCLDATDAVSLGRFWAAALGLELHLQDNGDTYLTGPTRTHTLWINQVPEPKTVKHRIHLDVHGSSVEELVARGARVLDGTSFPWVVMADPEGGEFCLFLRNDLPAYRLYEVVVDCGDHLAASRWWADMTGGRRVIDDRGFSFVADIPGAPFDALSFVPVPEPKRAKNRIHLDLATVDLDPLLHAGATVLRRRDHEISWDVLADPEGNELCRFG